MNQCMSQWLNIDNLVFSYLIKGYFAVGIVASALNAFRWFMYSTRKYEEHPFVWTEKLWEAILNFIFQFLGFVFLYISLVILVKLGDIKDTWWNLAIHATLFLVLFFYSIFCISGRGIEILHPVIDTLRKAKIAIIEFSWRGISIRFERESETNYEKKISDK